MAKLYGDENFPLPVVHELRQFGHDVITLQETGKGQQGVPDEAILTLATAEERAVTTGFTRGYSYLTPKGLFFQTIN